jgi:hypothetical protein
MKKVLTFGLIHAMLLLTGCNDERFKYLLWIENDSRGFYARCTTVGNRVAFDCWDENKRYHRMMNFPAYDRVIYKVFEESDLNINR